MRFLDIILKKKAGESLSPEEITFFIGHYVSGEIPDYQVSALLMAICIQGMSHDETLALARAMARSGDRVDLSSIPGIKVDKHSTGGVGDKTTLIVAPMAAALGIPIAKMSGRGLGHTGGTIDKLESIPGLSCSLSEERFLQQVRDIGLCIAGQTGNLAPADKKLYALRDVTGTVDQLGLIASSIMSKKLASGADKIILDVKCGTGAFMKKLEDARVLAAIMEEIGEGAGKETRAVISDMSQPLGFFVGNRLEVYEALQVLQGRGPEDLRILCRQLVRLMLELAGEARGSEAEKRIEDCLRSGAARQKFREMVAAQGGDTSFIDEPEKLLRASCRYELRAEGDGVIAAMNAEEVGLAAGLLGAGRSRMDERIDPDAGLIFHKKIGDSFVHGDSLCSLLTSDESLFPAAVAKLKAALTLAPADTPVQAPQILYD